MKKNLLLTGVAMLVVFFSAVAQQKKVDGTVKDSTGTPIPAATVVVSGTTNGTTTGADGKFTLMAQVGDKLKITSIGYIEQTVSVPSNDNPLNITLVQNKNVLGETVITALGVKREERALGYAVSTIKGEDIVKAGTTSNPIEALYGKAAGVGIQVGSAGPTGAVNIKIRGAAGLEASANTRPLFVVDGVILYDANNPQNTSMASRGYDPLNSFNYGSGINDINPEDIESITILKGAKASILYGSEAANGVVLITTKSGKQTRGLGITLSHEESIEQPVNYIDFQNEYGSGVNPSDVEYAVVNGDSVRKTVSSRFSFGPKFDGNPIMFFDSTMIPYQANPDNFMSLFRTGHTRNTTVAIAGASSMGNMRLSFTNYDYQDILDNMWQRKKSVSFSGAINASSLAKFEVNANLYSIATNNRRPNIGGIVAWGLNRDYPFDRIKDMYLTPDGYQKDLDSYGLPTLGSQLTGFWWHQDQDVNRDTKTHLITSAKATLNFSPHVFLIAQAALDYTDWDYATKNKVTRIDPQINGGKYSFKRENSQVQNYQAVLNLDQSFVDDKLHIFAFGGAAYKKNGDNSLYSATAGNLGYPDWYSLNNQTPSGWPTYDSRGLVTGTSRGSDVLYSLLGSATFSWIDEFYLELQARNDWNSTLPPQNNSYFYPGISANWNFSQRIHIPELQFGKLRLAWADAGRGSPNRYFALESYGLGRIPNGSAVTIDAPQDLFAGYLKPERKREFEAGFDTRFFDQSRLEIDFSFYTNNIYNQIIGVPLSSTVGASNIRINAGNVKNWGYELLIKATPVATPKYRWDLTLTAANQQSKVLKLYPGITSKTITGVGSSFMVTAAEGERYGQIKMFDYSRDPQGDRIVGSSGFYALNYDSIITAGNVTPKVIGGLNSDFYLKGFDFHIGIDYKFGGQMLSYSNYYLTGNGVTKNTLKYRDEEHGGMAYYIDKTTNEKVKWEHDKPAPDNAKDAKVYHDGLILPGVNEVTSTDGKTEYQPNDVILSAVDYYSSFLHDLSQDFQPDNIFKNDYIKLREIAVSYTLPERISHAMRLQKLTLTVAARNLFYLYKTLPNLDAESTLGNTDYVENSFYPAIRTYTFGINVSF